MGVVEKDLGRWVEEVVVLRVARKVEDGMAEERPLNGRRGDGRTIRFRRRRIVRDDGVGGIMSVVVGDNRDK